MEEQKQRDEEQKKAAKTGGDFESSDEEDTRAQIEIGAGKVKDIKEVNKEKQLAKDAQREQEFKWETMGTGMAQSSAQTKPAAATS